MKKKQNYIIWIQALPKEKNKKVISLINQVENNEKFAALKANTYSRLTGNNDRDKNQRKTQKSLLKTKR